MLRKYLLCSCDLFKFSLIDCLAVINDFNFLSCLYLFVYLVPPVEWIVGNVCICLYIVPPVEWIVGNVCICLFI